MTRNVKNAPPYFNSLYNRLRLVYEKWVWSFKQSSTFICALVQRSIRSQISTIEDVVFHIIRSQKAEDLTFFRSYVSILWTSHPQWWFSWLLLLVCWIILLIYLYNYTRNAGQPPLLLQLGSTIELFRIMEKTIQQPTSYIFLTIFIM